MENNLFLYFFIIIFVLIGIVIPVVENEFTDTTSNYDLEGIQKDVQESGGLGVLTILTSIASMFFWSFSFIPWYIELIIFMPMRIIFWVIVIDKIRGI